ncbi:MAG: type IV conjugative transfer system protein TraL [Gammaproteobacteria bacterium]|nr:type IV conjugative transfer system protein TraL [Gammaproteobacteria bacterium]
MNEEDKKYIILKFLDEEEKILGLPIDECIPVVGIIIIGFLAKFLIISIVLAFIVTKLMRRAKHSNGKGFLFVLAYWNY